MDYQAIKYLSDTLCHHECILISWNDVASQPHMDAVRFFVQHKDIRVGDVTYDIVTKFNEDMNELYTNYISAKAGKDIFQVVGEFVTRAKKAKRCSCSGRFWPSDSDKVVPNEYFGYEVDIRRSPDYRNLLLNSEYGENCYVLESELPVVTPSSLERLALRVMGYSINISSSKQRYYRTDY
jgi:hypothetical protein